MCVCSSVLLSAVGKAESRSQVSCQCETESKVFLKSPVESLRHPYYMMYITVQFCRWFLLFLVILWNSIFSWLPSSSSVYSLKALIIPLCHLTDHLNVGIYLPMSGQKNLVRSHFLSSEYWTWGACSLNRMTINFFLK